MKTVVWVIVIILCVAFLWEVAYERGRRSQVIHFSVCDAGDLLIDEVGQMYACSESMTWVKKQGAAK